jgi:hypothetical protein
MRMGLDIRRARSPDERGLGLVVLYQECERVSSGLSVNLKSPPSCRRDGPWLCSENLQLLVDLDADGLVMLDVSFIGL